MKTTLMSLRNRAGPWAACFAPWAVCLALSCLGLTAVQAAPRRVVLPSGSVIPVRLDQAMSSKTAQSGDRFTATVRYGPEDGGLPEGTQVQGVLREALAAENGKPGVLDLDFRRIFTPGGQNLALTGSLIALDAKSIQRSESGRLVASTDKGKDRLKFIGIGAGAGVLIGALTKGNMIMDTLLGAAAGYLYNEFGNKPRPGDVNLKAGTEFGIRLDRELVFQTNQPDTFSTSAQRRDEEWNTYFLDNKRTMSTQTAGASAAIEVLVDDREVSFGSARPFLRNGVSFVPLEPVARAANVAYSYDRNEKMIRVRNGMLRLGLSSRIAFFNGVRHRLSGAAEMHNGTLYVPMQFIGLATGGSVSWDSSSRTLVLTTDQAR